MSQKELEVLRARLASRQKTLAKKKELLADLLWNTIPKLGGPGSMREVGNLPLLEDGEVAKRNVLLDEGDGERETKHGGFEAVRKFGPEEGPWALMRLQRNGSQSVCCFEVSLKSRRASKLETVLGIDREISFLKELSHVNIPAFIDAYRYSGGIRLYIATPTMQTLKNFLAVRSARRARHPHKTGKQRAEHAVSSHTHGCFIVCTAAYVLLTMLAPTVPQTTNRRVLKQLFSAVAHCHYHFICHGNIHRFVERGITRQETDGVTRFLCVNKYSQSIFVSDDGHVQLASFVSAHVIDSGSKAKLHGVCGRRGYSVRRRTGRSMTMWWTPLIRVRYFLHRRRRCIERLGMTVFMLIRGVWGQFCSM